MVTSDIITFDDMIIWYNHGHRDALAGIACDPQVDAPVLKTSYKTGYQEALQRLAESLLVLQKFHPEVCFTETATYLQQYAERIT